MLRTFFHGAYDYVEMTDGIDRSALASIGRRRRRLLLAVIWLVLILFVTSAWCASRPAAFQWLSRVAPPIAHFLRPSAGSQVENGIRLEVVDTTRQGDKLLVHLTMEDQQENRLHAGLSPMWWEYWQNHTASGSCTREYEPDTGLLHLYLTCNPAADMSDFRWDRWVTVTVYDLSTRSGQVIEGTWMVQISPINEE